MKTNPIAMEKSKGKGKVRGVHIRKAANGHTMSIDREGEYDSQPRVYGAGQHPQMIADMHKALGLPQMGKKKPAARPQAMPAMGAQMLSGR